MDRLPLLFVDDVCHQLQLDSFKQVSQLSRGWSGFGAAHGEKRRELVFSCVVDDKKGGYWITDKKKKTFAGMTVADLNMNFDRIRSVTLTTVTGFLGQGVPLYVLERDVLPRVASIVTNCLKWPGSQNPFFFNAFKNCPGFNNITVKEHDEESHDFVARQVELGNVQVLHLNARESVQWPELAETLRTFVNSARFYQLTYRGGSFPDLVELYALFLERALAGELKPFSFISVNNIANAAIDGMSSLRPELRDDSKEIAWRNPNSIRRVLLQRLGALLIIKVE